MPVTPHTLDTHLKEGSPDAFKLTDCLQLWQGTTKKIELDPGTNYATRMIFADNVDTFLGGGAGVIMEGGSERVNVRGNDARPWNENLTSAAIDGLVAVQNWKPVWRGATDSPNHFAGAFVADKIETPASGTGYGGKYHAFYAPNFWVNGPSDGNPTNPSGESGILIGDIHGSGNCDLWGMHLEVHSSAQDSRLQGAEIKVINNSGSLGARFKHVLTLEGGNQYLHKGVYLRGYYKDAAIDLSEVYSQTWGQDPLIKLRGGGVIQLNHNAWTGVFYEPATNSIKFFIDGYAKFIIDSSGGHNA